MITLPKNWQLHVIPYGEQSPMANHNSLELASDDDNKTLYCHAVHMACYGSDDIIRACKAYINQSQTRSKYHEITTRELKTIATNLVTLYINGRFEDQLIYQKALNHGLNRYDNAAVKQAFRHAVNNRKIGILI